MVQLKVVASAPAARAIFAGYYCVHRVAMLCIVLVLFALCIHSQSKMATAVCVDMCFVEGRNSMVGRSITVDQYIGSR